MFYERIKFEHDRIAEEITAIENELNTLPRGKLICTRDRIYTKWYVSDGHRKTYIPKSNRTFAEQLAKKKYLMLKGISWKNLRQASVRGLAEFPGCYTDVLAELPAEMFCVPIAAQLGNFGNALCGISQIIPGFLQAECDDVIHAGDAELLLIKRLEISDA